MPGSCKLLYEDGQHVVPSHVARSQGVPAPMFVTGRREALDEGRIRRAPRNDAEAQVGFADESFAFELGPRDRMQTMATGR
jgi:hypothetical protein